MSRFLHFSLFFSAAVHLLLFSICPVSSRIYETDDAIVIEVDDTRPSNLAVQPLIRSKRSSNYGNPAAIPIPYALNPYYSGFYQQQQPHHMPFFPHPLLQPASSNASDVEDEPATSPQSKQQQIACGVGPASPPTRNAPVVGIVGGTGAAPNSWPFVVGLRISENLGVICGGSLISTTKILTAASCVEKLSLNAIKALSVSIGMHVKGTPNENPRNDAQHTRRVTRAAYHKDYNTKTRKNDIAVLTIDPPVVYSKAVSPVCLPPASTTVDQFAGKDAAIMGWGRLGDGEPSPITLQETSVKIFTNENCKKLWQEQFPYVSSQQLCAGATGKDVCGSDKGGPMVSQIRVGSTSWTQVGIASVDFGCTADEKTPSLYTNVASFRNWINNNMND